MVLVLFCGVNKFQLGFEYTRSEFEADEDVNVLQCELDDAGDFLSEVDVLVPLMSKITVDVISRALKLKLIIQYGVGLEGVDIPAATAANIPVCKIPSNDCANALSCAEHAIFLALACLRKQIC